ncbi:hypothetical protein ElyMa_001294800, partial [Elysia marginata]
EARGRGKVDTHPDPQLPLDWTGPEVGGYSSRERQVGVYLFTDDNRTQASGQGVGIPDSRCDVVV